ncbi:hypothetical protein KFK09_009205 [Dendrobium nobile]|uniref:Uncharacterized protein n=1 Tax=Dendrobium nobile TaxID=94219 RepID=A0A8T3BQ34_DENNO|nr:hypothetical protein KFK09_009205 [Dendrobium nobile]
MAHLLLFLRATAIDHRPIQVCRRGHRSKIYNIVLGVALEGSKRTLPIEEVEVKEVGAAVSGNGAPATSNVKDRKNEVPTKDR